MTSRELHLALNSLDYIPDEELRNEVSLIIMRAAEDGVKLKELETKTRGLVLNDAHDVPAGDNCWVQFSAAELRDMPKAADPFMNGPRLVGYRVVRGMYQLRYHRYGYIIEVSSKSLEEAKKKFADALRRGPGAVMSRYPIFRDFVESWKAYKKPLIKSSTYASYVAVIDSVILPVLGDMRIDQITREDVQSFLIGVVESGRNRTADNCRILLGAMFDLASEDYEIKSPMKKIVLPHYEVKKSTAIKKDEEKLLLERCREHGGTKGVSGIVVLLYTGMRVGELKTMTWDDKFVYCVSEKTRKGYADVIRKIPISPMLKKVLPYIDFDMAKSVSAWTLRDFLKSVFPERHLHELRYTFITRAKECGINPEVVMLMDGHKQDRDCATSAVDRGYTDYSEEYLLREMEKFDYEL